MDSAKKIYCDNLPENLPLFHQPWWLDCVSENWDVCIFFEDGKIVASMPYCFISIKNHRHIVMPKLTPFLGPFIVENNYKNSTKIKHEVKVIEYLMKQLPEFKSFRQKWHYDYKNWLPLYWQGYSQTTRYSYILENKNTLDEVWKELKDTVRKSIVKAQKSLTIGASNELKKGYSLVCDTYAKQGLLPPYSLAFFEQFYETVVRNNSGEMFFALLEGQAIAVMILVWDKGTVYPIISGVNDENKNTGAISFLMWHSIQLAHSTGKMFDFEGSMIKDIELFFRNFNGTQKTFFQISKEETERMDYLKKSIKDFKQFLFPER